MPGIGSVGPWEIILILVILLLVFGAKRLPEIGSALGKGIREFKGSVRDVESEIKTPSDRPRTELPRSEAPRPGVRPPETTEAEPAETPRREPESRPAGSPE